MKNTGGREGGREEDEIMIDSGGELDYTNSGAKKTAFEFQFIRKR